MRTSVIPSLALAALLSACGSSQDADTTTTPVAGEPAPMAAEPEPAPQPEPAAPAAQEPAPAETPPAAAEPARPQMTDGQIAAFLAAANKGEIDAAKLARSKSKKAEVKKLADMILKDHTAADKQAKSVFGKAGIAPEPNDAVKGLEEGAKATMDQLKALKGAEFDRAYVDSQVTMHQQVIDSVDQLLLPSAQNPELKQFIEGVRPKLQAHLDHAKELQAKLASP